MLQLQQQVEGGEEAAAKWAETHDALHAVHTKLQHERELVINLQNEKVGPLALPTSTHTAILPCKAQCLPPNDRLIDYQREGFQTSH